MKKTITLLVVLTCVFFVAWGIKLKLPVDRPDNVQDEVQVPWYESGYTSPVADEEWVLDPSIPDNYVPVPGEDNLYMVVDTSGNITQYRKRTQNADGTWIWEDVNPDIPSNYQLVNGSDNMYKVTEENGEESYFLYVRNEDGSYAFVSCDEFGVPYYNGEDAEVIATNYVHEQDNYYAVYDENGVKVGYAERTKDADGNYVWQARTDSDLQNYYAQHQQAAPTTEDLSQSYDNSTENTIHMTGDGNNTSTTKPNTDGSYVVINKTTDTVSENGYNVTYETTVYNTYSKDGKLLYTKKDGPYETGREKTSASETPNKDAIKDTLDGELARVSGSVTYDTDKANEVLAKLNAERTNQGLAGLSMDSNSEAYKLACIRAADMAIYNYSASESPLYGTLDDMVSRWGCTTANASENIWKAGNKTADDIHSRLQAYEGSRNVRMSAAYTQVGIAIVEKNGQTYIAEVYLK